MAVKSPKKTFRSNEFMETPYLLGDRDRADLGNEELAPVRIHRFNQVIKSDGMKAGLLGPYSGENGIVGGLLEPGPWDQADIDVVSHREMLLIPVQLDHVITADLASQRKVRDDGGHGFDRRSFDAGLGGRLRS